MGLRPAAKPYARRRADEVYVVSETIDTHVYESKTMAKAFEEITGIKVKHELIQEGDVIEKLQTQMQSGKSIYDDVCDSDLIGTHFRYGVVPLTDFMEGRGQGVRQARAGRGGLHRQEVHDGAGREEYQLPDQQFANLYWFRRTGSRGRTSRRSSRRSTATSSACR